MGEVITFPRRNDEGQREFVAAMLALPRETGELVIRIEGLTRELPIYGTAAALRAALDGPPSADPGGAAGRMARMRTQVRPVRWQRNTLRMFRYHAIKSPAA